MRILGLSAGNPGGSAEILLKEALKGAELAGATVDLVRIDDLALSQGPGGGRDDSQWFWDQLMESEGLIVSTPIYSRTIPGKLRLLGDKISGPQADVAFTAEILRMRAAGEELAVNFPINERVLRPRVAGFICVGGSIPPYWKSLAMPLMHTLTASAQIGVVDQVQFAGAGSPSSIVLDADALDRTAQLGRAVAAQLGRPYDEVEYRGVSGACPLCHLDVIVLKADGIECASCGAGGHLENVDGRIRAVFTAEGQQHSILSYTEKLEHFREVQETAARQAPERERIDAIATEYAEWDRTLKPAATP
jgi:multimeric flavodoxin WrbA